MFWFVLLSSCIAIHAQQGMMLGWFYHSSQHFFKRPKQWITWFCRPAPCRRSTVLRGINFGHGEQWELEEWVQRGAWTHRLFDGPGRKADSWPAKSPRYGVCFLLYKKWQDAWEYEEALVNKNYVVFPWQFVQLNFFQTRGGTEKRRGRNSKDYVGKCGKGNRRCHSCYVDLHYNRMLYGGCKWSSSRTASSSEHSWFHKFHP